MFAKLGSPSKGTHAEYDAFWATKLPPHLEKLEKLCAKDGAFTSTGTSPGELYLFAKLHQLCLVKPDLLTGADGEQPGALASWYAKLFSDKRTQKVLTGESSMGALAPYFVAASPEETMAEIGETGVKFDTIAREWRCKWSEDDEKSSLKEAQALLDSILPDIKALPGVSGVKRVVCGGCLDFKVDVAFEKAKFDETVGGLEVKFLAYLNAIKGITQIDTQTMTYMTV